MKCPNCNQHWSLKISDASTFDQCPHCSAKVEISPAFFDTIEDGIYYAMARYGGRNDASLKDQSLFILNFDRFMIMALGENYPEKEMIDAVIQSGICRTLVGVVGKEPSKQKKAVKKAVVHLTKNEKFRLAVKSNEQPATSLHLKAVQMTMLFAGSLGMDGFSVSDLDLPSSRYQVAELTDSHELVLQETHHSDKKIHTAMTIGLIGGVILLFAACITLTSVLLKRNHDTQSLSTTPPAAQETSDSSTEFSTELIESDTGELAPETQPSESLTQNIPPASGKQVLRAADSDIRLGNHFYLMDGVFIINPSLLKESCTDLMERFHLSDVYKPVDVSEEFDIEGLECVSIQVYADYYADYNIATFMNFYFINDKLWAVGYTKPFVPEEDIFEKGIKRFGTDFILVKNRDDYYEWDLINRGYHFYMHIVPNRENDGIMQEYISLTKE